MKTFIRIAVICAVMAVVLCGCGTTDPVESSNAAQTQPSGTTAPETTVAPTVNDGKLTYTVTVVDQNNNPVAGAVLQFCDDETCKLPVTTDDNGVVSQSYPESNYHVTVVELPAGFSCEESEFNFEANSTEMNIVVTAAQS